MKKYTAALCISAALLGVSCNNANTQNKGMESNWITTNGNDLFLLVGTYTEKGGSEGIYLYKFNIETGKADSLSMVKTPNPSFLTLSSDHNRVYAVEESDAGNSAVHAFEFNRKTGILSPINSQPTTGWSPCYIEIDHENKNVIAANYGDGSIAVFRTYTDGALSEQSLFFAYKGHSVDPERQTSPHAHSARYTPDGNYLLVTDLGTDKIYRYRVTRSVFEGQPPLASDDDFSISVAAGTGPRHFDFHPDGHYMYLLGELSGQVIVYDYEDGNLVQKQRL